MQRLVDEYRVSYVASGADVSDETVYAVLRGSKVSKTTVRKLTEFVRGARRNVGVDGLSLGPDGVLMTYQVKTYPGVHEPSLWQGRIMEARATIDLTRAYLERVSATLGELADSGVLLRGGEFPSAATNDPDRVAAGVQSAAAARALRDRETDSAHPPAALPEPPRPALPAAVAGAGRRARRRTKG